VNGYRARVEEHRRRLAEAAQRGERAAVPRFNWVVAAVEGVTDAARVPRRRRRPDVAETAPEAAETAGKGAEE
jgi:hypothetical protein